MAAIKKAEKLDEKVLEFDKPVDLDDALLRIELLTAAIEIGIEQIEEQAEKIEAFDEERLDLQSAVIDARQKADEFIDLVIEDLERVRQWITVGRTGEALHTLDRVLQEYDHKCKRLTVVAPMLPAAGGFGS